MSLAGNRIERLEPRTLLAAQLIADVNPISEGTQASHSTVLDDTLYFGWGTDLWKTDGTLDGTSRVTTVSPAQTAWFRPLTPFPGAGLFVFGALPAANQPAVFRSDGTPEGTFQLAAGGPVDDRFHVGERLFYWMTSDELWVSDGTVAGTARLTAGIAPVIATVSGDDLYFLTREGQTTRLWKSDGTAGGTAPIATVAGAVSGPNATPPELVATEGKVYIKLVTGTVDNNATYGLFTSDGSAAGTRLVTGIGRTAGNLAGLGGKVYFRNASSSLPGYEPWVSDGTTTTRLKDILPGSGSSNPRNFTVLGETIYFSAASAAGNPQVFDQVWKSDGTSAGTVLVKTLPPGATGASDFREVGGTVYFRAGGRLWTTDGTTAGTIEVALPGLGAQGLDGPYHPLGGRIAYFGSDPVHGAEWRFTDGTAAGSRVLDLTPETAGSMPGNYVELGGKVYFQAWDGNPTGAFARRSLVATDGTPGGTAVVRRDLWFAGPLVRAGDRIFFVLDFRDMSNNQQLWVSDGTEAGTRHVKTLQIPSFNMRGAFLTDAGGTLFFLGRTNYLQPYTLWRSDGTEAGTVQVSPHAVDNLSPTPPLFALGRTLYFVAQSPDAGSELYKVSADGGAPVLVKDIRPAADGSNPALLAAMNGRLYFTAKDDDTYRHLWSTDGTAAGTVRVSDVPTGPNFGNETPRPRAAAWNGALYFIGGYGTPDFGLWRTDGTPAGTVPVRRGSIDSVHAGGSRLYAIELAGGVATLLGSDGTSAGTAPVRKFGWVYNLVPFGDRVFMVAREPAYGTEVWSTDGTAAGTRIEADLAPGAADGIYPLEPQLLAAANMLVFTGTDERYGSEPRKWAPGGEPPPAVVIGRRVFYNNSAADGFDPRPGASDDGAVAPNKEALLPGQHAGRTHRTTFRHGLNGIMVDVTGLPAGSAIGAGDFVFRTGNSADPATWAAAAPPANVSVRRGAGAFGADRVTLTWADGDAVRNGWLQVTVKATPHTGLASPDVFYFGNLIGDALSPETGPTSVSAWDYALVRRDFGRPSNLFSELDVNRDGRVNVVDLALIRANFGRSLVALSPVLAS